MSIVRSPVGPGPVVLILAGVYVVALALLVHAPWSWALNRATVVLYVFFRSDASVAPAGALPEHYGVLLNVLLFVPLGAFLALLGRWAWWWVMLPAVIVSGAIETVQGVWLDREASWSDVVANTVGALLGAVAVSLLARARRRRGSRAASARRP